MLVHRKVIPISRLRFVHLGGERHVREISYPTTQQNDPDQDSNPDRSMQNPGSELIIKPRVSLGRNSRLSSVSFLFINNSCQVKCNQYNKPKRRFPCLIKQILISTPGSSLYYWRCYISNSSEQFIFPSSCLYKPGLRSGLWLEIRFGFEARLCHRLRCRFRRLLRLGFNS